MYLQQTGMQVARVNASRVSCDATHWTYEQLVARGAVLAGALHAAGAGVGDLVAVSLPRCAEQVIALVAIRHLGAAYLPLDQGLIHFLGRLDAQIKVRGHRIEPGEIEAALVSLGAIADAAVAVHDDQLTAWVVPATGHDLVASDLRAQLAEALPAPMIPARFALIAALPLNRSGKLDRNALPDPAVRALPETRASQAPLSPPELSPTQARLAAIIAEAIGRSDFGIDDDFFLLGGHSLLGTQVIVKARDAFGVDLTLLHLFEARTVAGLAAVVEELVTAHLASLSDADIARLMAG